MLSFRISTSVLLTSLLAVCHCAPATDLNFICNSPSERSIRGVESASTRKVLERRKDDYRYYNDKTKPYFIDSWPDVPFDTGEFYSGSVPIHESDPSRTLFFLFKPATEAPSNDITIWMNGGPGWSSLVGFLQENGPIQWQPGTYEPSFNPYAWSNITNMLWVEQPVGTGFSQGKVTAKNEEDIAVDFANFFKNWEKLFSIQDYKVYLTGESYAGRYVPYIAAEMLNREDKTYFDVSGALVYDPTIGSWAKVGQEIPAYPFAVANQDILNLPQKTLDQMEAMHKKCGYADYIDKYLTFPPPGNQPAIGDYEYVHCDIYYESLISSAITADPCFNVYHITDYCPLLGDVIGNPGGIFGKKSYFDRDDVKKALHAPSVHWEEQSGPVFVGSEGPEAAAGGVGDLSVDPIQHVLPQLIEATDRVLISHGDWDAKLFTNGTLLSIQNMTWHGKLGFQKAPSKNYNVTIPDLGGSDLKQGIMGIQHYERGLMWVETFQAGHQQPQYQPRAAFQHLQWMLGHIDKL